MFTFRSSLTFAVMAFIVALAVLLIAIQVLALRWATHEAASAHMDASSARALVPTPPDGLPRRRRNGRQVHWRRSDGVLERTQSHQPDHVERACRAALAGRAGYVKSSLSQFETEGLKPFFTRFGIHVGEAVVGNLGSTERMNYTALGNTVNLAARLEGLNKQFGTTILVSESVYSRVQHGFEFRAFELVIAKGMTKETRIFDMLAVSAAHAGEDTIKIGILHSLSGTMAISELVLKNTVLMLIADQNKKGGLLGRKLEPVVVDPASDWNVFAEKARQLLSNDKVAVVFGCWTSASRKSAMPIFEELNGLLCTPVQYGRVKKARAIFSTQEPRPTSRRFRPFDI